MGEEQWQWLEAQLRHSKAQVNVLVSSIQVGCSVSVWWWNKNRFNGLQALPLNRVPIVCNVTVGAGVQISTGFPIVESWGHFPRALRRLKCLLADVKPRGLVLLSGDVHFAEIRGTKVR